MKDFAVRHPVMLGMSICGFFMALAIVLVSIYDNLWFYLFLIIAGLVMAGWIIFEQKCEWFCPDCGYTAFMKRERYCQRCGCAMEIRRRIRIFKICPNGHRIEDNYNLYKNCPKCGLPLKGEK